MTTDFLEISYLAAGNERQRRCYDMLTRIRLMELLAPYGPVLAGTIPLGIDIPSSDLDIICEVHDFNGFAEFMRENFGQYEDFNIRYLTGDRIVCGFFEDGEDVEIYGSEQPAVKTNGYRHMLVEHRLLGIMGPRFRDEVMALKSDGMKTEPALAWLLGLPGDPHKAVLSLEAYTDEQLGDIFRA